MKLLLVCGPWGSGTTAVAGLLAQLGAVGFGPYLQTSDERMENSYELIPFREMVQSVASEQFVSVKSGVDVEAAVRKFRDRIISQELGPYDVTSGPPIFLKYPLSALIVPQICKVFDTHLIYVVRPLGDIEATRVRRNWEALYGAKGAEVIYWHMFTLLINQVLPTTIVRYPELIAWPLEHTRLLAGLAGLRCNDRASRRFPWQRKPSSSHCGGFGLRLRLLSSSAEM